MDNLTKDQRSFNMSRIRSQWTTPERVIHNRLKGRKIKHKMHPKLEGCPDLILKDKKTAVFIHGCFWHKCPKCYRKPKSNETYWMPKIKTNVKRDRKNSAVLKNEGWNVVVIWEHELKNYIDSAIKRILS